MMGSHHNPLVRINGVCLCALHLVPSTLTNYCTKVLSNMRRKVQPNEEHRTC